MVKKVNENSESKENAKKKKSDAGKGSDRRPMFISWEEWYKRWDYAFNRKKKKFK